MEITSNASVDDPNEFPPGTRRLEDLQNHSTKIVLQPAPTDDPNDPLNWSKWRKALNYFLVNFYVLMTFTLSDIGVVAYGPYGDLGITYGEINDAWALNYAGLALGCVFFIPLVYRYGRRPVYLFSMIFQLGACIWNAKLRHSGELMAAYGLVGLGGGIAETIVQITIADLFFVHQRATANGIFLVMQSAGTFLAPVCAGYIVVNEGWRWMWWWSAIILAVNLVLVVFFFEETGYTPAMADQPVANSSGGSQHLVVKSLEPSNVLRYGTSSQVDAKGDCIVTQSSSSVLESNTIYTLKSYRERIAFITRSPSQPGEFLRYFYQPFIVLFTFPGVFWAALTYGTMLSWYSVLSTVESENFLYPPYNFNSAQVGLVNLAPFAGTIVGAVLGGPLTDRLALWQAKRNGGIYEPEMRLWSALPTLVLCPLGILMFGLGFAHNSSWVMIAFGYGIMTAAQTVAFDVALTYVTDSYEDIIGNAFVGIVLVRNGISIIIMFTVTPWIDNLGIANCFISVAVLCFVFQLLIIPLMLYGKRCRVWTATKYRELAQSQPSSRMA